MLVIANWKMNMSGKEIGAYLDRLGREDRWARWASSGFRLVLCPPFVYLEALRSECRKRALPFDVMAQNMSSWEKGAYTGEVSVNMLTDLGVDGVLLGHSERRRYFGETDQTVAQKVLLALSRNLVPVVCFGENEEDRRGGSSSRVWDAQVRPVWEVVMKARQAGYASPVYWAYEPVWAIGTGKTAPLVEIREVGGYLRDNFGVSCASGLLYGGSVTDESVSVLQDGALHGFLVGSAFLDPRCVIRTFDQLCAGS